MNNKSDKIAGNPKPQRQADTLDKVQELYTERASFYDRFFINFLGWGRELEAFFRKSTYLNPNSKVLDAGCGTGIVTRILYKLAIEKDFGDVKFRAFDLTESMLDIFREWVKPQGAENIELRQANVLEIYALPQDWSEFDLVVSSTMLEYLPKNKVAAALANLKTLLKNGGTLLIFITKRSFITKWLAGRWWKTNTYRKIEIEGLFHEAGFERVEFKRFSQTSWWENYILVIEAKK